MLNGDSQIIKLFPENLKDNTTELGLSHSDLPYWHVEM